MRRRLTTAAFALAAALAATTAPALGGPPAPPGAAKLPAGVKLVECSPAEHAAAFRGRMIRLPGSERMGMRFTLLERTGADGFRPVKAPGLGRWRRSKPGVGAFGYRQGVRNLAENAVYRMRVNFRWWSSTGQAVRSTRRHSPSCRQFAELPNLRASLAGVAGTRVSGVVRYSVRVANTGRAPVSGAAVRLTVDGDVVDTRTLTSLAAGEGRTLSFRGPDCRRTVEARADPEGQIVEISEDDNAELVACADLRRK